nr:DUF1345 domain-containing protein [uncultured Brevundimonas sp.]
MAIMRSITLHGILLACMGLTAGVALLAPIQAHGLTRVAIGWDVGAAAFIAATLWRMSRAEGVDAIRRRAAALDQTGQWVLPLSLLAAVASIVIVIGEATRGGDPLTSGLLSLTTVALSWTFIHLIFALHYAHAFYQQTRAKDRGGLIFPGEDEPDYWDFLHFSLIIGVASQTADIQISDRGMRRLSSIHSLMAFTFNTVILALTINLMVGLLGQ